MLRGRVSAGFRRLLLRHDRKVLKLCRWVGKSNPRFMYDLSVVRIEAVERYHGRITLVRPSESRVSWSDPPLGWGDVALEGVDVI